MRQRVLLVAEDMVELLHRSYSPKEPAVLLSLDNEFYALRMQAMKERLLWRYTVTNQLV